jgi:hypothetical protein
LHQKEKKKLLETLYCQDVVATWCQMFPKRVNVWEISRTLNAIHSARFPSKMPSVCFNLEPCKRLWKTIMSSRTKLARISKLEIRFLRESMMNSLSKITSDRYSRRLFYWTLISLPPIIQELINS